MPPLRRKDERRRVDFDGEADEGKIDVYTLDEALYGKIREAAGPLVQITDGTLTAHGFTFSSNGLQVNGNVTEDDWSQIGEMLFKLEGSIQWLIGDWLVYGESLAYGDLKARVEEMGRDYNTVRNYMVVCRAFELSRRRYNLTFGHYQAAAGLETGEQQDEALDYAEKQKISVAAFRKAIHGTTPALPAERKYNIAQMTDSVYAVTQKDLMSIPVREIRSALDSLKLIQRKNAEAEAKLQDALEQRSKK